MWFTQSVVDAKEYLVREFYANVAHIKKGTKVTKVRNLKVQFNQITLNSYLGLRMWSQCITWRSWRWVMKLALS